jgi:hypothetical protein
MTHFVVQAVDSVAHPIEASYRGILYLQSRLKQRRMSILRSLVFTYSCLLDHRLRTTNESFFSNIPNILADWADQPNKLRGILGYFLCYDFLFGFGIWICAVQNLGSSHHASVVRVLDQTISSLTWSYITNLEGLLLRTTSILTLKL